MGEQVDGAAARRREQVNQDIELFVLRLGEKAVGAGLDEAVRIAHRDDGRSQNAHFDGRRNALAVNVGGLIGNVQIHVDGFGRDGGAGREQRDFKGFARPAINRGRAAPTRDQANGASFDVAQKRGDDRGNHDQNDGEQNADDDERGHDFSFLWGVGNC